MPQFLFLGIEVANGVALFNRTSIGDRSGSGKQGFCQCRLAGGTVAYEGDCP